MVNDRCARMMIDDRLFREVESNTWDLERRMQECDATGVGLQVLSTVPVMFSYWAHGDQADTLAKFLNDHIAECVRAHPQRFAGLGTVAMQAPDLAVRELERCVRDLGLSGIQIGTHVNDWNLDDAALRPVFECAHALGAAVFVHPWDMMGRQRMPRYFLPWLVGMPAETSLAMASIIFGGMLETLPGLRLAFAHGGGAFPGSIGRMNQGFVGRPDLCATHIDKPPSHYLRQVWIDSLVHDAAVLGFLLQQFGCERIALGSDYPFPLGEAHAGHMIEGMDLDATTRDWVLRRTALEFLGLAADKVAA
jgi:aminocarboxymuconate-semialdehyde decarboxylase